MALTLFSSVSLTAEAALVCPFADGNGASITGVCIESQGSWQTSLLARDWSGNGFGIDAYYDPVLNITWLADANAGAGSAFDDGINLTDGRMTFSRANTWAANLTLFGGSDWRLPTITPVNDTSSFNTAFSNNGSTDHGYAITGTGWGEDSEMGRLFYVLLGNQGFCTPNGASPASCATQAGNGLANTGPFVNLLDDFYWTGTVAPAGNAWYFLFGSGLQNRSSRTNEYRAWAVHAGDLIGPTPPPAPEPQAVPLPWAAALGLGGVLALHGAGSRRPGVEIA